jgi:hypothetical protein
LDNALPQGHDRRRSGDLAAMHHTPLRYAERQRQWQRQWEQRQSMPRQTICQNVGGWLSCTTY